MTIYGPAWPLKKGETDLYQMNKTREQQISFELRNLLLTAPGENISDYNYGVGLRRFVFDQNNRGSRSRIYSEISSKISRYLPSIVVNNISISSDNLEIDSNRLKIVIEYKISQNPQNSIFELNLGTSETGLY